MLYLTDLLTETLEQEDARRHAIQEALGDLDLGDTMRGYLEGLLGESSPEELTGYLTAGIRNDEVRGGFGLVTSMLAYDDFLIDPLPNLLFTRDSSVWVRDRVAITSLAMPARKRETELTELIYTRHPRFVGTPTMHGAHLEHVEGGDVLLLAPGVIAVGVGERTTPAGVERLARQCFQGRLAHTVLAVPIAQERATMHLDTICTLVDTDKMVVYPNVADSLVAFTVTPTGDLGGDGVLVLEVAKPEPFLVAAAKAMGIDTLEQIDTGLDPVTAEREQWDDGNNTLALAPRVAVAYERNDETNARLEDAGIEVVRIAGSSSARAGWAALHVVPLLTRPPDLRFCSRRTGNPGTRFGVGESTPLRKAGPMAETFFSMFTPEEIARISASGTKVTLPRAGRRSRRRRAPTRPTSCSRARCRCARTARRWLSSAPATSSARTRSSTTACAPRASSR